MTESIKMTEEKFNRLAKAAEASGGLKSRKVKSGMEFGIWLNNKLMAKSIPNADGTYSYEMYI